MSDSSSEPSSPTALGSMVQTIPASPREINGIHIHAHVPLTLDLAEANYSEWCRFYHVLFGKYGLADHVDGSTPASGDSDWVQNDFAILLWFYNTVTKEIRRIVSDNNDTAYIFWRSVKALFRDNKETRSVYIANDFHSMLQGDMSVIDYCTKMKTMADTLRELGSPVTDRDLVLNILRGLNPRLRHLIPHVTMQPKLPSFLKVRSYLLLEEHQLAQTAQMNVALVAQQAPATPYFTAPTPVYGLPFGATAFDAI